MIWWHFSITCKCIPVLLQTIWCGCDWITEERRTHRSLFLSAAAPQVHRDALVPADISGSQLTVSACSCPDKKKQIKRWKVTTVPAAGWYRAAPLISEGFYSVLCFMEPLYHLPLFMQLSAALVSVFSYWQQKTCCSSVEYIKNNKNNKNWSSNSAFLIK